MFEVQNQPPPLEPYNLFASDVVLREAVKREGAGWAQSELTRLAQPSANLKPSNLASMPINFRRNCVRSTVTVIASMRSNFTRRGTSCSVLALKAGLHSSPWAEPKPGAHVARAAGTYMLGQIESGVYCPVAMTYGSVPSLRHTPAIAAEWLPRIFSREYDRRFCPARLKTASAHRHGHDRKPGRLRPAHEYDKG